MCDDEAGEVPLANVFRVLRAWRVGASQDPENPGAYLLVKGKVAESKTLPECVSREMLHYLQRKFGIWIHHFYHPEMMAVQIPPSDKPN
jgi:hypothetical protein